MPLTLGRPGWAKVGGRQAGPHPVTFVPRPRETVLLMTLLIALLWLVTLAAVGFACYGPRRWHRAFTTHVRPGAEEPSPRGFQLLAWRNWLFALTAVAVSPPPPSPPSSLTEDELYEAALAAMDQPPGTFTTVDGVIAAIEDDIGRDVSYVEIETDDTTSRRTLS